jgi:hypothetical protein
MNSDDRSWFQRNWKWFVPVLAAVAIGTIAGFILMIFGFVMSMFKSSEPYQHALAQARHDQAVVAALGEPIAEGRFTSGNMEESGASGKASLAIPVSGPKGEATIFVEASKSTGQWHYEHVAVELSSSHQRIELEPK